MNNKRTNDINLFSIDVEAHLQKLAANTYRSPHHYPVELIRLAIKRDAKQIRVNLKANKLEIEDDGRGIKYSQLQNLNVIFNPGNTPGNRENAIESMKTANQIGLLAIFSPAPTVVDIETINEKGNQQLKIAEGKLIPPSAPSLRQGTRIILHRHKKDWQEEIILLKEYLRGVPQKILINNTALPKKNLLTHPMVSMKIPHTRGQPEAWIGIPHMGDICRIWLMDQYIPWHHSMITPWHGFVFEAAIEYNGQLTRSVLDYLTQSAEQLYLWLAKRYTTYPPAIRKRIEDLFFKQNRLANDTNTIHSLRSLKVADANRWLNVSEIIKIAARKEIFAIPDNEDPSKYNLAGKTVLSLSQSQVDFLVNFQQLPIQFLSALLPSKFPLKDWLIILLKIIQNLFSTLYYSRKKWLDESELDQAEKSLLTWLKNQYTQHKTILPGSNKQADIIPRFTNSRGIFSTAFILSKNTLRPTYVHLLRRKHPDLQRALNILRKYPENIDIVGSLFVG